MLPLTIDLTSDERENGENDANVVLTIGNIIVIIIIMHILICFFVILPHNI
jgi:hypothetical protein